MATVTLAVAVLVNAMARCGRRSGCNSCSNNGCNNDGSSRQRGIMTATTMTIGASVDVVTVTATVTEMTPTVETEERR